MNSQVSIAVRAAFIADSISRHLSNRSALENQDGNSPCCKEAVGTTPKQVILRAYSEGMGEASGNKFNLFALRRLLGECGYTPLPSTEQILEMAGQVADDTGPTAEDIDTALDVYVQQITDSEKELILRAQSLCETATVYAAEETIRRHAATLRRKRFQLLIPDDYGHVDGGNWYKEVTSFVDRVVLPAIGETAIEERTFACIIERVEQIAAEITPEKTPDSFVDSSRQIAAEEFEVHCAEILQGQGWKTRLTKRSGDQGVDIVAERGGITVVFQCKWYNSVVGNGAVQEVHAGKGFAHADIGVVVSNANFTSSARELAHALGVLLLHHSQLGQFDRALLEMFWTKGHKGGGTQD